MVAPRTSYSHSLRTTSTDRASYRRNTCRLRPIMLYSGTLADCGRSCSTQEHLPTAADHALLMWGAALLGRPERPCHAMPCVGGIRLISFRLVSPRCASPGIAQGCGPPSRKVQVTHGTRARCGRQPHRPAHAPFLARARWASGRRGRGRRRGPGAVGRPARPARRPAGLPDARSDRLRGATAGAGGAARPARLRLRRHLRQARRLPTCVHRAAPPARHPALAQALRCPDAARRRRLRRDPAGSRRRAARVRPAGS